MRDFIARRLISTANRELQVRRRIYMRPPFEVMPMSHTVRFPHMHMRQCRKVSPLTSRVLVETLTFAALLRLLRVAQVVLRWNMVALRSGFFFTAGRSIPLPRHHFTGNAHQSSLDDAQR